MSYQQYKDYIAGDAWYEIRSSRAALNEANFHGLCEVCLEHPATQCHHISYKHLYHERMMDLEMLCGTCHLHEHGFKTDEELEQEAWIGVGVPHGP